MDFFDTTKIKEVVITFENLQCMYVDGFLVSALGVERSKLPKNMQFGEYDICPTCITLDKEVYRSPDIIDRLRQFHDISWIEVRFENSKSCTWCVPWEDDPMNEDENILQHNNECVDGMSIYINDYRLFN